MENKLDSSFKAANNTTNKHLTKSTVFDHGIDSA